jgi:hypothetical protein
VLLVTTQSLNTPYPLDPVGLQYTPVIYSTQGYGEINESILAQQQFLNLSTTPNPGQILILRPWRNTSTVPAIDGPRYLKVHKIDNNGMDNTIALGQIHKLLLKYSTSATYTNIVILTKSEYPTYYLYEVTNVGPTSDNYILDYQISSLTTSFGVVNSNTLFVLNPSESINPLGYYDDTTGLLTWNNTPNVTISFTASLQTRTFAGSTPVTLFYTGDNGLIKQQTFTATSTITTFAISGSYYPIQGSYNVFLGFIGAGSAVTISNVQLIQTQSIAPSAAENDSVILEPYITTPNYYNSDFNPLINNIDQSRLSVFHQDVDYSTGIVTPTNFGYLISGSAAKAAVQDSNYTTERHIIPRYKGSKSTSQHLNYWTPGDEGTYGKTPTIESLKTMVAYCDDIGGWPPERENASAAFIKYLIKSDGSVVIPNTTQYSLEENKGTFESGENVLIQYQGTGNQATPLRKVIRGGTRIEPILYNQSGSMPGGTFVNSITLTDNNATGNVVSNFQARLGAPTWTLNELNVGAYNDILFNRVLSSGSAATISSVGSYLRYQSNSGLISEGVTLNLNASLKVTDTTSPSDEPFQGSYNGYVQFAIVRRRSGITTILYQNPNSIKITQDYQPISLSVSVPFNTVQNGDEFYVRGYANRENLYVESNSEFTINQFPSANSTIGISNFWVSSSSGTTSQIKSATSGAFGNNLIYTTASSVVEYYGNPTIYQQNIPNSGFNNIILPWSIEYGDEFRFEGREDMVYQVKQASVVNGAGLTKPLLVVELNNPIPTSGSVNFDQFLIRRYVDEASQILIEGFKPINSTGPYIVRPEYVTPELDKDIDQFILDLTQKGLLP